MSSTSRTHPLHLEHGGVAQRPSLRRKICAPFKLEVDTRVATRWRVTG